MFGCYIWRIPIDDLLRPSVNYIHDSKLYSPVFAVFDRVFQIHLWPYGARPQDIPYMSIDVINKSSTEVVIVCNATVLRSAHDDPVSVSPSNVQNRLMMHKRIISQLPVNGCWGLWKFHDRPTTIDASRGYVKDGCVFVLVDIEVVSPSSSGINPSPPTTPQFTSLSAIPATPVRAANADCTANGTADATATAKVMTNASTTCNDSTKYLKTMASALVQPASLSSAYCDTTRGSIHSASLASSHGSFRCPLDVCAFVA